MFDWITSVVEQSGYFGIALLMLGENIFPPIPSEVIMPLAGFVAAQGNLNVLGVLLAGVAGALLGALPWYYAGKWFGVDRLKRFAATHGRLLTLTPQEIEYAHEWFNRHGRKAVLIGRLVPIVRTLISVPAGLTRMPLAQFLMYSAMGTAAWTGLLLGAGYVLESQYERVSEIVNPATNFILILIVGIYVYRVIAFPKKVRDNK